MTLDPKVRRELDELIHGVCEDSLDNEGESRLAELLAGSEEALAQYLLTMELHARLIWDYRLGPMASRPSGADVNQISASIAQDESPTENALNRPDGSAHPPSGANPPVKSPVLGFLGGVVDYVNHSRRLMFLLVAMMLCGWFVFQIGSVLLGRWWAGDAQVADRRVNQPNGPKRSEGAVAGAPGPSHGDALAWLSGSIGSRWQIVAPQPASAEFWEIGTEFTAGRQVNLVAGLGEITFRSGAKVILSAPARFSVTSPLETDLQLGKLTARVPHDAAGFTVNTPAGSVVDLGTEFGVEVTPDHKLDVQVFVGEVKVSTPPADGSGAGGDPDVHVTAGKTVHVVPGKPPAVVESNDKGRFQRDLKIESDSADKQLAAYLNLMTQLKPVVWLRMEGKEGDRTIHDEAGRVDAKLFWDGPGNPFVSGAVGKSLWLRGPKLKDFAILPDYPKAQHGTLSVSAWVYADSLPPYAGIAMNWGEQGTGQFEFALSDATIGRHDGGDLTVHLLPADGKMVIVGEGAGHPLPLHEWQHVAFVADGETLRIYRQGREVATAKCGGAMYPVQKKSLGIGVRTNGSESGPSKTPECFWDGKLDEIAIFNDALSPEDIKKLSAAPPR